jgi:hypothetical protein
MASRLMSTPAQYKKEILKRTESCRIASTLSREEVIDQLHRRTGHKLKFETYKKWETRTPIPHAFIIPFCDVVGADPYFLLTGKPFKLGKLPASNPGESTRNAA